MILLYISCIAFGGCRNVTPSWEFNVHKFPTCALYDNYMLISYFTLIFKHIKVFPQTQMYVSKKSFKKLHNYIYVYFLTPTEVYEVCDLLECDVGTLINALTQRTVETSGERVKTDLGSTEVGATAWGKPGK